MFGRLSVTTKDLHRLLDLTDLAKQDEPGSLLPWSLLHGLSDLVGRDSVTYESLDAIGRTVQHQQVISGVNDDADDFTDESAQASFRILYCRSLSENCLRTEDYASARRLLAESQSLAWQDTASAEGYAAWGPTGRSPSRCHRTPACAIG